MPELTKIESKGSYWWFDEVAHLYMRLPKEEQPRERAEWSDERAGVLQDAVWHPYIKWAIRNWHWRGNSHYPPGLYITYAEDKSPAYAPLPITAVLEPGPESPSVPG